MGSPKAMALDRGDSVDIDDIPKTPSPILCISRLDPQRVIVPAVRCYHPVHQWGIFPLSKQEYGDLWYSRESMANWMEYPLPDGWTNVEEEFMPHIDYPVELLRTILDVLRREKFHDGTPLSWTRWSFFCKNDPDKISLSKAYTICHTVRTFTPRVMYIAPPEIAHANCADLGFHCCLARLCDINPPPLKPPPPLTTTPPKPYGFNEEEEPYETARRQTFPKPSIYFLAQSTPPSAQPPPKTSHFAETDSWYTFNPDTMPSLGQHALQASSHPFGKTVPQHPFATYPSCQDIDEAYPHPCQFIVGAPLRRFESPDPTQCEIDEFKEIYTSPRSQQLMFTFSRWATQHKGCSFDGDASVAKFRAWDHLTYRYFSSWQVYNPIAQAKLASNSFEGNAFSWWNAHTRRQPFLLVTYYQLLEWIRKELVPTAEAGASQLAWYDLQYNGDVEKYLKQLTDLLLHHPVNPKVSLTLATKPFGDELVYRVQAINDLYGGTGMSIPQLITQIKNFVLEKESSPGFAGWRRQGRDSPIKRVKARMANVPQPKTTTYPLKTNIQYSSPPLRPPRRDQTPNTPPRDSMAPCPSRPKLSSPSLLDQRKPKEVGERTFIKVRYGKGPTPCFVCGSAEHPWIFCEKKARGKCAVCGSRAHPIRLCAQRYRPRPEVRIYSAQITPCMRDDPQYIFTNMPDSEAEDDNATEVELSADECDSEDEIEEVMGNTVLVRPLREVEDEEDMESIEWNWHFSSNWAPFLHRKLYPKHTTAISRSVHWHPTRCRSRPMWTTHLSN